MDAALSDLVERALAEDVGTGDVTARAIVPPDARASARIVQKQAGVVFGLDAVEEVFRQVGADQVERREPEGEWRDSVPVEVASVSGPARARASAATVAAVVRSPSPTSSASARRTSASSSARSISMRGS